MVRFLFVRIPELEQRAFGVWPSHEFDADGQPVGGKSRWQRQGGKPEDRTQTPVVAQAGDIVHHRGSRRRTQSAGLVVERRA